MDPLIQRSSLFFDRVDAFLHQILATFLKKHFSILSHIKLVTKESAVFLRVFANNSVFGTVLPSWQQNSRDLPQAGQEEVLVSDKISQQM